MPNLSRTFTVASHDTLADIRRFIELSAIELSVDPETVSEMIVAANEAITNTFVHGYKSDPGDVEVEISLIENRFRIAIRDNAIPFDPTTVPDPDIYTPLETRKPGGLGVHMIREFTDQVQYSRTADNQNELVLSKEIFSSTSTQGSSHGN